MQETIELKLSRELRIVLESITKEEGISPNDLIDKAIRDYLFFRRFHLLRERMAARAQSQGIRTDQDVFDRIS